MEEGNSPAASLSRIQTGAPRIIRYEVLLSILMYIIGKQELCGIWQAEGFPFYDETHVWEDRVYPFRCKINCTKYSFENHLRLDEINDLRNAGKIWTWSLQRASGSKSMFSISDVEFNVLLTEFMKKNPFSVRRTIIPAPYPYHESDIRQLIHMENGKPKYEYSIMALLNSSFSKGGLTEIFGNYTDFLS